MSDLISRQAAIDEIEERKNANGYRNVAVISELNRLEGYIMRLPSAQPENTDCDYCHEDSDGYVKPIEKNCHAFVRRSPIDGWVLSMKYGAWRKDIPIRFCPICGRELKHDK